MPQVVYINIIEGMFRGPSLMSTKGRFIWSPLVVVWWGAAFVIGSAIPSVGSLSGLVAACAIFQFTYTFPPLFMLGLEMGIDAAKADEPFTTPGVRPRRVDTWRQLVSVPDHGCASLHSSRRLDHGCASPHSSR